MVTLGGTVRNESEAILEVEERKNNQLPSSSEKHIRTEVTTGRYNHQNHINQPQGSPASKEVPHAATRATRAATMVQSNWSDKPQQPQRKIVTGFQEQLSSQVSCQRRSSGYLREKW
jgi:hypothetical protein